MKGRGVGWRKDRERKIAGREGAGKRTIIHKAVYNSMKSPPKRNKTLYRNGRQAVLKSHIAYDFVQKC